MWVWPCVQATPLALLARHSSGSLMYGLRPEGGREGGREGSQAVGREGGRGLRPEGGREGGVIWYCY